MVVQDLLAEVLVNLEHLFGDITAIDLDLSSLHELFDLVVGQLTKLSLKVVVELLSEGLSACLSFGFGSVLEILVLVRLVFDFHAVELFFDVRLNLLEAVEDSLVSVDKLDLL